MARLRVSIVFASGDARSSRVAALIGGVIGTQLGSRWLPVAVLRGLFAAVLAIAGLKLMVA